MTPSGSKVALFHLDHEQGAAPADPLVQGTDGDFYATTNGGGSGNCGSAGCGVIFKVTSQGQVAVLHEFDSSQNDGFQPVAPLIEANDGVFYGTVPYGAPGANGAAFTITAAGKFALLHVFRGQTDGRYPYAALVQATDGNYYGTTCLGGSDNKGVIFRISAEGKFSVIHEFDGADGDQPQVALVQHTNGKLYGDTFEGGSMNHGVFYSLDIGAGPFVGLVSTAGKVGEQVGILGQGFMAATGVEFNGVAAKFTVASDTYLAATVPEGATTGFVTVATRDGRLKSNKKFYVRK